MRGLIDPTVKPDVGSQIDPEHPLAQQLVRYWLFGEGTGSVIYDYTGGSYGGKGTLALNNTSWGAGPSVSFNGTNAYADSNDDSRIPDVSGGLSLMLAFNPVSIGAYKLMSRWDDGTNLFLWLLELVSPGGTVRFDQISGLGGIGTSVNQITSSNAVNTGKLNQVIATSNGAVPSTFTMQLNGVQVVGGTNFFASNNTQKPGLVVGAGRNGASRDGFFNGSIMYAAIWQTNLALDLQQWLWREPFAMFMPATLPKAYGFLTAPSVPGAIIPRRRPREAPKDPAPWYVW